MEKYPCTCGGENANCFRCDGTGLVESTALPIRSDGRVRPLPNGNKSLVTQPTRTYFPEQTEPPKSIVKRKYFCTKCRQSFLDPVVFIYHDRTQHPKRSANVDGPKKSKKQQDKLDAQTSVASDEKTEMPLRQMLKKQQLLEEAKKSLKNLRKLYPRAQICYDCLEIFKTDVELTVHSGKSHAPVTLKKQKKLEKRKKPSDGKQAVLKRNGLEHRESTIAIAMKHAKERSSVANFAMEQEFQERRLDATYGMGGFARDHGRFGSAATYDDMDDESSP